MRNHRLGKCQVMGSASDWIRRLKQKRADCRATCISVVGVVEKGRQKDNIEKKSSERDEIGTVKCFSQFCSLILTT